MSQGLLSFSGVPSLPQWRVLPQERLRGIDTPYVESLLSYVLRLCYICNITPHQLYKALRYQGAPDLGKKHYIAQSVQSWIGPSSFFESILTPLLMLTGQDNLYKGTFYIAGKILNGRHLHQKYNGSRIHQWCPTCYLEWNHETSYEPLIWSFALLTACPIHNVYLVSKCPSCDSFQRTVCDYDLRRKCHKCKSDLGYYGVPANLSNIEKWIDARLISFCSYMHNLDTPIPFIRYHECLKGLINRKSHGENLPPAIREFIYDLKFKSKYNDFRQPSIDHLLNISAFLGTTIEEFLENPAIAEYQPLFDRSENFTKIAFLKIVVRPKLRGIALCMHELLKHDEILLPTVQFLTKRYSVPSRDVSISFPDIIQRYRNRLRSEYTYMRRRAQRLTLDYAFSILDTEYQDSFDYTDLSTFIDRISDKTGIVQPNAKSCAETAIVLHTIQISLNDINNGFIDMNSSLDPWIQGNSH